DLGADGVGAIGAVDAVNRGAEIHRARAERVARAAGHETRQIGLARDHLRRRGPVRPFLLVGDGRKSLPLEAVAADADSITQRPPAGLDQIEVALGGLDDDGARRLAGAIEHHLLLPFRIELVGIVSDESGLIAGILTLREAWCRRD